MPGLHIESQVVNDRLKEADAALRSIVTKSDFIWDEALAPMYPTDEYWWLYSTPPEKE